MIGAEIEIAKDATKVHERGTESAGWLPIDPLKLLQQRLQFKRTNDRTSYVLPDLELVTSVNRTEQRATDSSNPNLAMGNPSSATLNPADGNNYLHSREQFVMSYNRHNKTPNWVSWQLDSDWLGPARRTGNFAPDEALPKGFERAMPNDYSRSGYDRGHNIPSGDRTASSADNEATFLMSNIAPQAPDNNQGPWEKLESHCRDLARQGKQLYIIAGSDGSKGVIGRGVNVPETFWKVIVVLPRKGMNATDVTEDTEVIAVDMPNRNGIRSDDWRKFITTVDAIEKRTGYDFLSNVPAKIQAPIEARRFGE